MKPGGDFAEFAIPFQVDDRNRPGQRGATFVDQHGSAIGVGGAIGLAGRTPAPIRDVGPLAVGRDHDVIRARRRRRCPG